MDGTRKTFFSVAEKTGFLALGSGALLLAYEPILALIPLLLFLGLCACMPFFPQYGFFLPVISCAPAGTESIALTFDDGPSPESTPVLLELLARYRLSATFFVIGEKAEHHPELIEEILRQGHAIGNHSWRHDNFLMLRGWRTVYNDITATQQVLQRFSIRPLVFRPPVGVTSPRLIKVLADQGMVTVTFSCRAFDRGNRDIDNLADKILSRLQPGNIIMLHDLAPPDQSLSDYWHDELDRLLQTLTREYDVVALDQLLGRPIMENL